MSLMKRNILLLFAFLFSFSFYGQLVVDDAEVDFATLTEEVMGNIDIYELS